MRNIFLRVRLLVLISLSFFSWNTAARVLDNFDDNQKTDWEDFTFVPGLGLPTEANGQFSFNLPPAGTPLFVASTKKSETFTVEDGRTVEFRIDLVTGNGPDSFAVLAFIPTANEVSSLGGYGFAKSTSDILVTKSSTQYFYNENPPEPLKNENVTMVLSLTGDGPNVIINAKLLDKDSNNAVLWEETFVDTPAAEILADGTDEPPAPFTGTGNFVLLCYEDFDEGAPQESYEVTFDNAETYVLENTLVDDFNDNTKTNWEDFTFVPGLGLPTEENGQFNFNLPPAGTPLFVASANTSRTYDLIEGEQIRFSVDLVSGNGPDAFAVLAFIPTANELSSLGGYSFAKSTSDILITKSSTQYFYNENPPEPLKNENVRMTLTLTVDEGNVIIHAQATDLDAQNAILFEQTFIDTPAEDILADGTDTPPSPFLGSGRFVLLCYEDFDEGAPQDVYTVIFDNAIAGAAPVAGNLPPVVDNFSPAPFSNFADGAETLSFSVSDDQPVVEGNISVILNGATYDSSNGLTFTGTGNSRTVSLDLLGVNTSYTAVITARDELEAVTSTTVFFDTFDPDLLTIEVEDYNFDGGFYIDNPVPLAENTGPQLTGYVNQFGLPEVDFHDTRTSFENVPYRPTDLVRMRHTLDNIRAKFTAAGGSEAGVWDYDIGDVAAGEWLNYTRTFPEGSYEVYLRESVVNGTQIETILERVTSDRSQVDQTTEVIGSFIAPATGFRFRTIPLTDATGQNKIVLQLSGEETLRLRQVHGNTDDMNIFQNYLVFVPVGEVVQRPIVSSLTPANNTTVDTFTPTISAEIQNRETSVQPNSIKLFINDASVTPVVTPNATGAAVTYAITPLPPVNSQIIARLEFMDDDGTSITNEWFFTLTYRTLDPAHRASGSGLDRGMNHRFVQTVFGNPALDNTLSRAENQLAPNSTIPEYVDTNMVVQVINHTDDPFVERGDILGDTLVPGLDPDLLNGSDDFAVEVTAYLELSAGIHRFGVKTDDGYKLSAGASLQDINGPILEFHNGGPANETFDVMVTEPGLYPFRLVWYERSGSAEAEWTSVDRETGEKTLINDPDSPSAIKAYVSLSAPALLVESSATIDGEFNTDSAAVINGNTITIPLTSGNRFFRLNGTISHEITASTLSGGNLVLTIAGEE